MSRILSKSLFLLSVAILVLLFSSALFVSPADSPKIFPTEDKDKYAVNFSSSYGQKLVKNVASVDLAMTNTVNQNFAQFSGIFMYFLRSRDLDTHHYLIQLIAPIIFEVLLPLYLLLIILTAIYLTWGAISPNMRAQTKGQLEKLILGMILCSISLPIYDILIETNNFVVDSVLSTTTSASGPHWEDLVVPDSIVVAPAPDECRESAWEEHVLHDPSTCGLLTTWVTMNSDPSTGPKNRDNYGDTWSLAILSDSNDMSVNRLIFKQVVDGPYPSLLVPANYDPITGLFYYHKTGVALGAGIMGAFMLLTGGKLSAIAAPLFCMLFTMMIMPYLVLAIRYVVVIAFGILFPFTLFCMSFEFTKSLGDKLLKQTLMWMFFPAAMALFTVLSVGIANAPAGDYMVNAIAAIAAYFLIGAAPMMITGMMGVAGGVMLYAGQTMANPRLVFMANILQGNSAQSFTQAAYMSNLARSRLGTSADTAKKYQDGISDGMPASADVQQPPPPYSAAYKEAMESRSGGGGQSGSGASPRVYGGETRTVGELGDGIGFLETAKRAAFRAPVAEGTTKDQMTAQQWSGVRFAAAGGFKSFAGVGWYAYGIAGNLSPKKLMAPAGYMLRGLLRQSISDWPIGKTLSGIANKMTGYWQTDSATGENVFNYGWQSQAGIIRDLSKSAADLYKGKEGGGAPGWAKAAATGIGLTMPLAVLAAPAAPLLGLAIAGGAGLAFLGGSLVLKPVGEWLASTNEKAADDKAVSGRIRSASRLRGGIRSKLSKEDGLDKEGVWGKLNDAEKKTFGDDEPTAMDRAKAFYDAKTSPLLDKEDIFGIVSSNDPDDARKTSFGWSEGMDPAGLEGVKDKAGRYYASAVTGSPTELNADLYTRDPVTGQIGQSGSRQAYDERLGEAVTKLQAARANPADTAAIEAAEQGVEASKTERSTAFQESAGRESSARNNWDYLDSTGRKRHRDTAKTELMAAGQPVTEASIQAQARYNAFTEGKENVWTAAGSDEQVRKDAVWDSLTPQQRDRYLSSATGTDATVKEAAAKDSAYSDVKNDPSKLDGAKQMLLDEQTKGKSEAFAAGFFGTRRAGKAKEFWQGPQSRLSKENKNDMIIAESEGKHDLASLASAPAAEREPLERRAMERAYREGHGVWARMKGSPVGRLINSARPSTYGERDAGAGKGITESRAGKVVMAGGIVGSLIAGPAALLVPLSYDRGRDKYEQKAQTRGTVEYGRARRAVRQELDGGFKISAEPSVTGATEIRNNDGKTYSLEEDGIYVSNSPWGGVGRRKATVAEGAAVGQWYRENRGSGEAIDSFARGDIGIDAAKEGGILSEFEGAGLDGSGSPTGMVGLRAVDELRGIVHGGKAPDKRAEKLLFSNGTALGKRILGRLGSADRKKFGYSKGSSAAEKDRARLRAVEYFIRKMKGGGTP
ncbi:MAG: hypothetical protein V1875_00105 [Candidatus Altiarchaeota archaeon]